MSIFDQPATSNLPAFAQIAAGDPRLAPQPGQPSGNSNLVVSGLGSGIFNTAGSLASGVEGLARAAGFQGAGDAAQAFAQRQRDIAATYATPENEAAPIYTPRGFAYRTLQMLPNMAMLGAGALGGEVAAGAVGASRAIGGLLGGTAAAYPGAVGDDIQRAHDENQPVDQSTGLKAAVLGVPGAALQAALPTMAEGMLTGRIAARAAPTLFGSEALGARAVGAAAGAAVQVPAAAAGEALMQQMGDPNRSFADRSQAIVSAALSGGVQGAFYGAALHSLAKKPANTVTPDDMTRYIDNATNPGGPTPPPQLPDPRFMEGSSATTPGPMPGQQPMSGEPVITEPPPAAPPPDIVQDVPQSAGALPPPDTPPIILPDQTTEAYKQALNPLTNEVLLKHAQSAGPDTMSGKAALEVLADRLNWKKNEYTAPDPDDVKRQLQEQDDAAAAAGQKQALADQQTQQIKQATRGFMPDFLTPHLGDDMALKSAIYDEAQARDADGKSFGSRLTNIAKQFGVLDDAGKLVDPRLVQEQNDTIRAQGEADQAETTSLGANPDTPSRVLKDAIPDQHKMKWQALEDLRESAPQDMQTQIDDLQSRLAAPKRGEAGQIVKATSDLRKAIEGQKAVDAVRGTAEAAPRPATTADETQGAKKFSDPVSPAQAPETPPTQPLSKQEQLKAAQSSAAVPSEAPATNLAAAQPDAEPQPQKGTLDPVKAKAVMSALKDLRGNISDLMDQKPVGGAKSTEKSLTRDNGEYQALTNQLDKQQQKVGAALKSNDPAELAKIGPDHFSPDITDRFYDRLSSKGQRLLDEHNQKVDTLLDAVNEASGKNYAHSVDVYSSREPTPHDDALSSMVDQGKSLRDMVEHTARNGSNSIRRTMAAKLLQMSTADPSVRFGTMGERAADHPTLRNVYGDYHSGTDSVRIYDKSDLEHTSLHEFAHAATVRAIENDPKVAARAQALYDEARRQMTPEEAAHPSMENPAEMFAEAFSNPDFANLLDSMDGPQNKTLWQHVKDFVRQLFGLPQGSDSMLDHVEHLGGQMADIVNETRNVQGIERLSGLYARSAQDTADSFMRKADRMVDPRGIPSRLFRTSLFWRHLEGIATSMGRWLPSLQRAVQTMRDLHNYHETNVAGLHVADSAERALKPEGRALLSQLKLATFVGVDPRVSPDRHTWLTDSERVRLTPEIKRYNEMWNQAKRGDGKVAEAYSLANNFNRTLLTSAKYAELHTLAHSMGRPELVSDAMERFHADPDLKNDPRRAADFWYRELVGDKATGTKGVLDNVREAVSQLKEATKTEQDPEKLVAAKAQLRTLDSWERTTARDLTAMNQAPNFPSRQYGSHYAAFDLKEGFNAQDAAKLRSMLDARGFGHANIDHNIDNNSAYVRVDGVGATDDLVETLKKAQAEGLVKLTSSGEAKNLYKAAGVTPTHIQETLDALRSSFKKLDEDGPDADRARAHNQALDAQFDQMHRAMMDVLPPQNASKLFAHRENVQGMNTDMRKAGLDRGMNTARAISNMFLSDRMAAVRNGLRDEVDNAKRDPDMSTGMKDRIQAAANEYMLRDAQRQWHTDVNSPISWFRRMTHVFELGLSVPYALTLHSQTWTLGAAELMKHFGAMRSLQALAGAHGEAFKIMKAAFSGNDKFGFVLTPDKMRAAGVKPETIEFMTKLQNMGAFNSSRTQWTYDGFHHHEGLARTLHDISGGWTLYSEMLPRIVQGLASRELYNERAAQGKAPTSKTDFNDVHSFANHQINQSQFSWLGDTGPRAFGKQGAAGMASPLLAQFQGFRVKLLEKMHREFVDALGDNKLGNALGARGGEYTSQARRFLLGHLAAQVAVAGTMGLPFVGMFAGAYDKLADWATGDHTHDLKASYRGWLSQVFGDQMGEVLAHGAPRLGGVDLSSRLGEDRLLPLTDLVANKQKFEDAVRDQAFAATGSAVHLGYNMYLGARDMSNGDYLEGSTKVLPEMFRNLAEATEIGKYGYTDKSGFKYPGGGPSSADLAAKSLGFTPSDEANYSEKSKIVAGLRDRQEYDTQNIQTHLARAFNRQDPAMFAQFMSANSQYMASHPGLMPPGMQIQNYLQEHMRSAAMAGALGTPLGVNPRDFTTQRMISFGNSGDR